MAGRSSSGRARLADLERAHSKPSGDYARGVEDYLEVIYELIREKGYARTVDISSHLHVRPPSATRMIQNLHNQGFLIYEKYRGIVLTQKGERLAKSVKERHELIADFLKILGVDDETAQVDSEGIEHHLHSITIDRITKFVKFAQENPKWFEEFKA